LAPERLGECHRRLCQGMSNIVSPLHETPLQSLGDDDLQVEGIDESSGFEASSSSFFFGQLSDDEDNEEGASIAAARLGEIATTVVNKVLDSDSSLGIASQRQAEVRFRDNHLIEQASPIVTDEGQALADALQEARRALDYARQFVTSPSLDAKSHLQVADAPGQSSCFHNSAVLTESEMLVEKQELPIHDSEQRRVNDLREPVGASAAQRRVCRERSRERSAAVEKRKQEQEKLENEKKAAERSAEYRKEIARRLALEKRALRQAQQQEEEERALTSARREADAQMSREYAKSAARRAKSERMRQKAKVNEVLADLVQVQRDRLLEDELKAQKLQQRCEESDWSACKPVVSTKPMQRPPRTFSPASRMSKEDAQDQGSPNSALPRIAPPPRRARSLNSMKTQPRPSDFEATRLPRIVPPV